MADIDSWFENARKVTHEASKNLDLSGIQRQIGREPTQMVIAARHDIWRAVACAALASLLAFTAIERLAGSLLDKPQPTWVAAPSAASPFSLLIGK
ncbi:NAD+ synthetase [Ralstonia mannitolilytica]|uniref:CnrY/NccY family anti-sigma factor n=1 Tax=Ralstonia mannitolilytica TaxID=105219 RepID=UPI0005D7E91D|nr:CnrY/NccY family anti-sigma factor [Ralstonia mannitolilytica]AJW47548.1 NAD+ synthetase [Ralstonia mannitolilytica]